MNVLVVNNSHHRALRRHRRQLSAYLHRIGNEAYIGRLSQEGMADLLEELRETATRQSMVTVYRIRQGRWEAVEHIGATGRIENGVVAVGRAPSRAKPALLEPDLTALADVVMLAGLVHDTGKLLADFQAMVKGQRRNRTKHRIRHQVGSAAFVSALLDSGGQVDAMPPDLDLSFPEAHRASRTASAYRSTRLLVSQLVGLSWPTE